LSGDEKFDLRIAQAVDALLPGVKAGCDITGTMVRVIRFHCQLDRMTGWMFRMFCVPSSGPTLKLVLFWNGTLIMFAIGFRRVPEAVSSGAPAWGEQ
jgi:hypothetical protein